MFTKLRMRLIRLLGGKGGAAITVGSHITLSGEHTVAISVLEGWGQAHVRLSPEGARKIAAQIVEWAAHAEKRNAERGQYNFIATWRAVNKSDDTPAEAAVQSN